jgi:hypothetical protein
MFKNESPHNLLPSQRKAKNRKGWTVFLVFFCAPPKIEHVAEIIAFPDNADSSLPRLGNIRVGGNIEGRQKADLGKIPDKYRFKDIDSLEQSLKRGK